MGKKAVLVEVSFTVRVIVDERATEDEIIAAAKQRFIKKGYVNDFGENIGDIDDDEECPYEPGEKTSL